MHRDLFDALRCPHPHDESWLVALVQSAWEHHIRQALLECPRCQARFPIRDGIAEFRVSAADSLLPIISAGGATARATAPTESGTDHAVDAIRLAALLDASTGSVPVVLCGALAASGAALAQVSAVPQVWINPVAGAQPPADHEVLWGILQIDAGVPLGRGTLAAAALDAAHAAHAPLRQALAYAIRPGGRLVAPAGTPVPPDVRRLAEDAEQWVGEVTAAPGGLVTLRRQSPPA